MEYLDKKYHFETLCRTVISKALRTFINAWEITKNDTVTKNYFLPPFSSSALSLSNVMSSVMKSEMSIIPTLDYKMMVNYLMH